jgi:uridine kinase
MTEAYLSEYSKLFDTCKPNPRVIYTANEWLGKFPVVTIYGYRSSGKTTLGKYFAHNMYYDLKIPRFTVFSHKRCWHDTLVSKFIVDPNEDTLNKIIEFQRNLLKEHKHEYDDVVPPHLALCLIFDDIVDTIDLIPLLNSRKELGIYVIDICQKRKYVGSDVTIRTISPGIATYENGDVLKYNRYNTQIGQSDFQFTDETIGDFPLIHIQGKAWCGKTSFGKYLLQRIVKDLNVSNFYVMLDSHTVRSNRSWASLLSYKHIKDFDGSYLNKLIIQQKELVESDMKQSLNLIDYKVPKHLSLCIVIDEVVMLTDEIKKLLEMHKKLGIYVVLITKWKNDTLQPDIKVKFNNVGLNTSVLIDKNHCEHIIRFENVRTF